MVKEEILKKAYAYRKRGALSPVYRKAYFDYIREFDYVTPTSFRELSGGQVKEARNIEKDVKDFYRFYLSNRTKLA